MDKIPFSIYDFFSYLFAGFFLLIGIDYALGLKLVVGRELSPIQIAFWVVASYIAGHVISHWASWLLETKILGWLGKPEDHLFEESTKRHFKHYRSPFPSQTIVQITTKYQRMNTGEGSRRDMFLFCFHNVKEACPQALIRLNQFLNLYGFCRNLCLATWMVTGALLYSAIRQQHLRFWVLSAIGVIVGSTLFFRYLKFYRLYSVEMFGSFLTGVRETAHLLAATTEPVINESPRLEQREEKKI